jgi:hypothetical protein
VILLSAPLVAKRLPEAVSHCSQADSLDAVEMNITHEAQVAPEQVVSLQPPGPSDSFAPQGDFFWSRLTACSDRPSQPHRWRRGKPPQQQGAEPEPFATVDGKNTDLWLLLQVMRELPGKEFKVETGWYILSEQQ